MTVVREPRGPVDRLRALALAYSGLPGGVFVGVVEEPPAVIVAAGTDAGLDAGRSLKAALEANGGRGGGNARLAQGSVNDPRSLDAVVAAMLRS